MISASSSRPAASTTDPAAPAASADQRRTHHSVAQVARGITASTAAAPSGLTCQTLISRTVDKNRAPINPAEMKARATLASPGDSGPVSTGSSSIADGASGDVALGDSASGAPASVAGARGRRPSAVTAATAATGAWHRKIARQSNSWVSTPPAAGPTAAPRAAVAAHERRTAEALWLPRASSGSEELSSSAAPAPWTQRQTISVVRSPATPAPSEASPNTPRPVTSARRLASRDANGTITIVHRISATL